MDQQDFMVLRCNFQDKEGKPCGKALSEGLATSCSHIFCTEHAQEWFRKEDRCPICLDKEGKIRVAKVVTATNDQSRVQKLLIGRSPSDIQLAASTAMQFWLGQKMSEYDRDHSEESRLRDAVRRAIGDGRKRLLEVDVLVQSRKAGADELRRQLRETEDSLFKKKEEINRLRARCEQSRRAYKETLARAAGLRPCRSDPRPARHPSPMGFGSEQRGAVSAFQLQRPAPRQSSASRSPRRDGSMDHFRKQWTS